MKINKYECDKTAQKNVHGFHGIIFLPEGYDINNTIARKKEIELQCKRIST